MENAPENLESNQRSTRFSAQMVEGNVLAAEMSGFVPLQPGSEASSLN
jgi:hypothetical protein